MRAGQESVLRIDFNIGLESRSRCLYTYLLPSSWNTVITLILRPGLQRLSVSGCLLIALPLGGLAGGCWADSSENSRNQTQSVLFEIVRFWFKLAIYATRYEEGGALFSLYTFPEFLRSRGRRVFVFGFRR